MGPIRVGLVVVAVIGAAGAAWYFWPRERAPLPAPAPIAQVKPAPAPEPAPEHFPVPQVQDEKEAKAPATPLPALNDSDKAAQDALAGLIGADALRRFFNLEGLVRNIVVTVDNLPRKTFAMRLSPLKPVGGLIATTGKDEAMVVAAANAARYAPWVSALEKVNAKKLVALYVRLHPLFQQAYVELGYPTGHFNTRLVKVIDHLLTAPEPPEPLRLTVPHVLHEYADPVLESESVRPQGALSHGQRQRGEGEGEAARDPARASAGPMTGCARAWRRRDRGPCAWCCFPSRG